MVNKWDYKVVGAFNDFFYKDLLQKKHMNDSEKFIKTVNTPDDEEGSEMELNEFFFVLVKGHNKYLLNSKDINELPLFVIKSKRVGYKGEGYNLVLEYQSARFKPEKHFSFKQLVDEVGKIKHDNEKDFLLWKIICWSSFFDRLNVRVASNPSFGKDSIMDLIGDIVGNVAVVQKPTIAKLEYLSLNKVLVVNELMNLSAQEYRDIEQYLLSVGAFKNTYTKRSRAGSQGKEDYDISKLSLVLAYNNIDDYPDGADAYFDRVQTNQVKDRFLPLKFNGKITELFPDIPNPSNEAEVNKDYFVKIARTIRFIEENWRKELKPYSEINLGLVGRWKRNFDTISRFINLYSDTEEEYKTLIGELYKKHLNYLDMIYENKSFQTKRVEDFGFLSSEDMGVETEEVDVGVWKDETGK